MMYRLDEHWEWTGKYEAPDVLMAPSQYMLRNCFLAVEADEHPVKYYVEEFGDDNLIYSTDYPHADSKFPEATETFLTLPLSEDSKRKILWDNYARLYNLSAPEPAP
jgi:predicted TIM-barrel fold metal-dependent hydrolase